MRKALLVTTKHFLEDIYKANLKSYLNIELQALDNLTQAMAQKPEILIVQDTLLLDKNASAPKPGSLPAETLLIVLGQEIPDWPKALHLSDIYDIKYLVRLISTHFNITAQSMIQTPVEDFFPLPIGLFKYQSEAVAMLYSLDGATGKYEILFKKNDPIQNKITQLIEQGVTQLYTPKESRLLWVNNASQLLVSKLKSGNINDQEKCDHLEAGLDTMAQHLISSPQDLQMVTTLATTCVEEMRQVIKRIPSLSELVGKLLANKNKYTFMHSILCAHVSGHLIKKMPWGAKGQSEKLAFAFFFHDIWLAPLLDRFPNVHSEDELLYGEELTEKEKQLVMVHANMAHDLVLSIAQAPVGSETIIMQHHGSRGGNEFVSNFPDYLSPLSKVAIIAHAFVEEFLYNKKKNKIMDLKIIIQELSLRFHAPSYQKIVAALNDITL